MVERLRRPDLAGKPLVLGPAPGERPVVQDCSYEAEDCGLHAGLPLRQVMGICREAVILPPDPAYYARLFRRLQGGWENISPAVEAAGLGCAYLDLAGLEPVYPTIQDLLNAILDVTPAKLKPRVGIGPGKFVARMAALEAGPGFPRVVTEGEARSFLAPLPVRRLPVPDGVVHRLEVMGLTLLGQVAGLPISAVQAQFGEHGRRLWELAGGWDSEPVVPGRLLEQVRESLVFPAPTADGQVLQAALKQLVARLLGRPDMRGKGVRSLRLALGLEGQRSWEKTVTLKEASSAAERIRLALQNHLSTVTLPAPAEAMALEVLQEGEANAKQLTVDAVTEERRLRLAEAARQLQARYGESTLFQVVSLEPWSRLPERRYGLISFEP
mgnify:CR=1 FL=1